MLLQTLARAPGAAWTWAAARALLCGAAGLAAALPAAANDLARAEEIVQGRCFVCHGVDGESSTPLFPRLAGQRAAYVARQLADYQSGRRRSTTMQPMVEGLQPAELAALGAYFESRPVQAHAVADPALAQQGRQLFERGNAKADVPACVACHGDTGGGTDRLPRLAGQHAAYLERQLKAFHQRERTNDNAVMQGIAARLSEVEMQAVSAYISGLK